VNFSAFGEEADLNIQLYRIARTIKLEHILLLAVMGLAFYVAFIPNLNYLYPVHIDEWRSLAYFETIAQTGTTGIVDPFYGGATDIFYQAEMGFHLFWTIFHQISGIPWLSIFRYFPGVIFIITILSVYILARRQGYGWEAALFACLVITTVGILGPAFLVPVALALVFIPLVLFLAFNFRTVWSYLVVFLLASFLVLIHAITYVGLVIILAPYVVINVKGNFQHSLGLALALAVPVVIVGFIAPFSWIDMIGPVVRNLLQPVVIPSEIDIPMIIHVYGVVPIIIGLLGVLLLGIKGGRENYGLLLGLVALLLMLVVYYTFHYGETILYNRGILYMMLALGIIAGYGLMRIRAFRLPEEITWRLKPAWLTRHVGKILCLVLITVTLATCIPLRLSIPYYHMIDEEDYQAFLWIRENISGEYHKAVLDPWKATVFTAVTLKQVYTRIHMGPTEADMSVYAFLNEGCTDTSFLQENGISIVYTTGECRNPDLFEVRKNVYLLE
jgi:hypothetical protein